eukprot:CAMPEP_0172308182 /NCGR_PEP_ID=MMETSP1058-20130122/8865_1 /TAXON_ID=83371 /ORGANISM="Detonula confervacea, Strain CCMP 353" /LENGTH=505 /DNA_ID=CAMNT_0013020545 /DNA_START=37 /DNA_END=1554 /DNA_ORIENTATION=-
MPFLTRNPSYYLSALQEESTEPLHIGLYLGNDAAVHHHDGEEQAESVTILTESSWIELATAIQQTARSIRCMWLRVKIEGGNDRLDDTALAAFRALGQGLVGATAIESLVLEDRGMGVNQLSCLREYLARNTTLRGIKFLRTHLDTPSSLLLNDFFVGNSALRVLDLTANPRVDDETIRGILGAILRNDACRLETFNVFETLEGDADGISESCVGFIASFVSRTPSLTNVRLRIRELNDTGIGELANTVKGSCCNISCLEIGGIFGDEGMLSIAEALKTNRSIRKIDIGMTERLTDRGGQGILQVVQGQDESWQSKTTSNHTLQSVYISDRAGSSMSKSLLMGLQSITKADPHRTLQGKAWNYINKNIEDLSSISLDVTLRPCLLEFVSSRGGVDSLFCLLRSRKNAPELFTNHPTPEKVRLTRKMEKASKENEVLKALLKSERRHRSQRQMSQSTNQSENIHLRDQEEDEQHQMKAMARCLLLPFFKAFEMCKHFMDLLKESHR